jgi:hypothetical protein
MKIKFAAYKFGIVVGVVVIFSLMMSISAYARAGEPSIYVSPMSGTQVQITITIPAGVNAGESYYGVAGGYFDCTAAPPDTVVCFGPLRKGTTAIFSLFRKGQDETVLKESVASPRVKNEGGSDTVPTVVPPGCLGATITEPCTPE